MFDLEESISEWRKQLLAAGVKNPLPLEELENHLREDICHLVASGKSAAAAFQIAIARVGNPGAVGSEFKKTRPRLSLPVLVASLVWAGLVVVLAVALLSRWADGKLNLLLTAHIFSLTIGYGTVFFAGSLGIYGVCRPWRRVVSANDQQLLNRAIHLFTLVSAVLVAGGFVLGMVWSSQNRGFFWANDPREIGALGAAAWLAAFSLIQQFGRLSGRSTMRWSIVGNMAIGLAWFGAGALSHGYTVASYWPLDAFLGVHLFFLGMSLGHGRSAVEA